MSDKKKCPVCGEWLYWDDSHMVQIGGEYYCRRCAKEKLVDLARDYVKAFPAVLDEMLAWLGEDVLEFAEGDDTARNVAGEAPAFEEWIA